MHCFVAFDTFISYPVKSHKFLDSPFTSSMDKNSGKSDVLVAVKQDHLRTTAGVGALAELPFKKVVVHPLVLLSVVDHFNRMGKIGNQKRVVGILLGCIKGKGILDISNCFAGML